MYHVDVRCREGGKVGKWESGGRESKVKSSKVLKMGKNKFLMISVSYNVSQVKYLNVKSALTS